MANARSIIEKAARKIHVLGRGQTMPAEEAQSALGELNLLVSSLSSDADYIFNNVRETFPLGGGKKSYTIGVGGDFNTARPIAITAVFVTIGNIDYPMKQLNAAEYAAIGLKAITGIPEVFYYENNTPLSTFHIYPAAASYTLNIWSLKAIDKFVDLTTDYSLPEGVEDMLVYNLAVRIAPDYEKEASMTVVKKAAQTMKNVQVYNKRHNYPKSSIDIASDKREGNIFSGWYVR